jgi:nitrilase
VAPGGDVLAGPLEEQEGILYAEVDIELARLQRRQFDAVGHYSRPDVFALSVDTTSRQPVTFR